ncbi:hypothetical protein O5D80_007497 [Batrachochytrium dendrobatidis]|nr:hypothetical protein O5D80_007497 [Batrachochytrium dendrobatidis]
MKLVDILFVLTAAATANAILIPSDNNGSPQASVTSSQVSGPTNEPDPGTSDDWQSIMDELDLSILDKDQQQPMDEAGSGTFNQVSGSTNEPIPQIPEDDWQEIMDIIHSKNPNQDQQQQNQQDPIDLVDPSTSKRGQQQPIDESSSGTFSQVFGPTNEPIPQIPDDDWQEIMDIIHSNIPNQNQQQPIDELSSDIFNQVSGPTNEPIPQIPDDDWQEIMDIIH